MKILVVDDSSAVRFFLRESFESAAVNLEFAQNGIEALEKQSEQTFDLVLLDWEMPLLNGPDTLKTLRGLYPQLPVIMMTTKNATADMQVAFNLGVSEYMMKPFTRDILFAKIEQVTGRTLG